MRTAWTTWSGCDGRAGSSARLRSCRRLAARRWPVRCAACEGRTSVTAGTIFDRTRTPLTVWFTACWLFATQKDGISAQSLQRSLEIGSYPTAWAMLHRLRSVLVRPGRDRLSGTVEVDETYIGGAEPGLRGGRAKGKKVLTGIAVEVAGRRGSADAGWRCWPMPPLNRCTPSSPATSSPAAPSSPTRGRATAGCGPRLRPSTSQPACRPRPRRGSRRAAARRAPRRRAGQAMAAGHPPGFGRRSTPARLPGRVRVPIQPAQLTQPRPGLLPCARARRRARSGPLPGPPRRQEAAPGTGNVGLGSPADAGASSGEPAMENGRPPAAATDPTPVK